MKSVADLIAEAVLSSANPVDARKRLVWKVNEYWQKLYDIDAVMLTLNANSKYLEAQAEWEKRSIIWRAFEDAKLALSKVDKKLLSLKS